MKEINPARIVLIEDNPGDALLFRRALDLQGDAFTLEVIPDGEQALAFLGELAAGWGENDPCVLILDLHLPKRDGLEVLRAVRITPILSRIHVVIFSGALYPREQAEVTDLDVRLIVKKPGDMAGFLKFAEQILDICKDHSHAMTA